MSGRKIVGLILLAAGIIALVYGGFTFTKDKDTAKLGPLELSYTKKERLALPPWVGFVAVAGGALLLVLPGKK